MLPAAHQTLPLERRFQDDLGEATALAALSPSSHNCQPWGLVRPATPAARQAAAAFLGLPPGDDARYLVLALDPRHELTSLPAHAIEMRVSCGAYWRMLLRGLAAQGWTAVRTRTVERAADNPFGGTWRGGWNALCVVALRRGGAPSEEYAPLYAAAAERRTNRGPYHPSPLDQAVLDALAEPVPLPGEPPRDREPVTVRHLTGFQDRQRFASLVADRAGIDFSHPDAWRETHSFLRWSTADARDRGDGFTLPQLFGPLSPPRHLAMRVTLHPYVMRLLCAAGYERRLADGLAGLVRRDTPALLAVGFADEEPDLAAMLHGGARLADYWLAASRAGLALHPISVLVQHEDLRRDLQSRLGLSGRVFFVSRLGRPVSEAPPSARRAGAGGHRAI